MAVVGTFGVAGSIGIRPGGCRVRLGLLSSLECALGIVEFVWVRSVHWSAPWESWSSFRVSGLIGKRPRCRFVRSGSMGSMGCALLVAVFFQGRWVDWVAHFCSFGVTGFIGVRPGGRRVRSGTMDSLGEPWGSSRTFGVAASWTLGVVWFVPGRHGVSSDLFVFAGLIGVSSGSFRVAWFSGDRAGILSGLIG